MPSPETERGSHEACARERGLRAASLAIGAAPPESDCRLRLASLPVVAARAIGTAIRTSGCNAMRKHAWRIARMAASVSAREAMPRTRVGESAFCECSFQRLRG